MRCLNPRCGRDLLDDWAFCDRCGTDNRPPAGRVRVVEDEHEVMDGEFCVRCGASILDVDDEEADEVRYQVWGGWGLLVAGALALAFSQAVRAGLGRKDADSNALGVAYMAARYGSYAFAAGVVLLLISPALRRRR